MIDALRELLAAVVFIGQATAYWAGCDGCTGITATGTVPVEGRTLACPRELPARTLVYVTGVGARLCEDRGGAIRGNVVDVFVADSAAAVEFGRRPVLVFRLVTPTPHSIDSHVTR